MKKSFFFAFSLRFMGATANGILELEGISVLRKIDVQQEWFIATALRSEIFVGDKDPSLALSRWCARESVRKEEVTTLVGGIFGENCVDQARKTCALGADAQELFEAHFRNSEDVHFISLSERALAAADEIAHMGLIVRGDPVHKNCAFFFKVTRKGHRYSRSCSSRIKMSYRVIA